MWDSIDMHSLKTQNKTKQKVRFRGVWHRGLDLLWWAFNSTEVPAETTMSLSHSPQSSSRWRNSITSEPAKALKVCSNCLKAADTSNMARVLHSSLPQDGCLHAENKLCWAGLTRPRDQERNGTDGRVVWWILIMNCCILSEAT